MTIEAPLSLYRDTVRKEWIDHNGHMNVAYYVLAFDWCVDAFFEFLGAGPRYLEAGGHTTFAIEAHVNYLRELREGDPMRFDSRLVGFDAKRLHHFHEMYHADEGYLAATSEWLTLHVDLSVRRSAPFPPAIAERLAAILEAHADLERPPQLGRAIGLDRKPKR